MSGRNEKSGATAGRVPALAIAIALAAMVLVDAAGKKGAWLP